MHWPAPMTVEGKPEKSINWINTWKEMEKLYKAHPEKLRAIGTYRFFFWLPILLTPSLIGVSNVSVEFLDALLKEATVVPAVNQIERHP